MGTNLNSIKSLTRKFFIHKFAAAFTAVCIVFMCVPCVILKLSAATGTGTIYFDDVTGKFYTESTFENEYTALSSNYSWNSGTNTLTLTNFVYSVDHGEYLSPHGVSFPGISGSSIKLELVGTNSITSVNGSSLQQTTGINGDGGTITVSGSGSLTVTANSSGNSGIGINGNVTLNNDFTGSLTINATSTTATQEARGIGGNITVNSGTLAITATGPSAVGVGGNTYMSGGTMRITATAATGGTATGLRFAINSYSGGTIAATTSGGDTNQAFYGGSFLFGASAATIDFTFFTGANAGSVTTTAENITSSGYLQAPGAYLKITPSGTGITAGALSKI
jgi:hypothetical protein